MITTLKPSYLQAFDLAQAFDFMNTPTSQAISQTVDDLRALQGSALIVGGIAVGRHGLERTTAEVVLLYENTDTKIIERLGARFELVVNAQSGWHEMRHKVTQVRLELIPEGALGQYGFLPFCNLVTGADGFISLHGLIWLKLIAGRGKDDIDIIELYKLNPDGVSSASAILPPELLLRFNPLISKAQAELNNDPYTNPAKLMKRKLPDGTIIDLS